MFLKVLKFLVISLIVFLVFFYLGFLLILPKILNNSVTIIKYEKFLSNKLGQKVVIDNFEYKSKASLFFTVNIGKIYIVTQRNEQPLYINNLSYKAPIYNLKHGELTSSYIFADIMNLKKILKSNPDESNQKFDLTFFPMTNIKSGKIVFNADNYINIKGITSEKKFGQIRTKVISQLISKYLNKPVIIGDNGYITYDLGGMKFDNFRIKFPTSSLYISGSLQDIKLTGKNLPVREFEESFLYFYKLRHPNKRNFIENFTNFVGKFDIDIVYKNGYLTGTCVTNGLGARFTQYKIPVYLPLVVFNFNKGNMIASSSGTFGGEKVFTDVLLTGIMSRDLELSGNVESVLTNKITSKYYPNITIVGNTPAKVSYHTKNGITDVFYSLRIPRGSNLLSDYGNLDNIDENRKLTMHTQKNGTPIKIKNYNYSVITPKGYKKLLFGAGLIDKYNNKYALSKLLIKSNEKVSVNYIKSFLRNYINNGDFDIDMQLDFYKKELLGNLNFYNISHDDFLYLDNAKITVDKDKIDLKTYGTFYSSPITIKASGSNNFSENITIHDIDIHLNSLYLHRGRILPLTESLKRQNHIVKHSNSLNITIEQGRVIADRIYGRKFDVKNVNIQGSLKNNIAHFIIPKAAYAQGLLSAKGIYNISNHSSDIEFFASDIDSNEVATNIFRLPNQIQGNAFATLHILTKNKFNDIKAKATFAVSDGFLPKIGNQEFMLKKSKNKNSSKLSQILNKFDIKLTLSKITNIDFTKPNIFYSNLYGTFNIENENVHDVKIFSKSDNLGLYIEGNYNIDTECGDVSIFGRRNKTAAKKIRIFKIPINLIYRIVFKPEHTKVLYEDKIKMIPQIKTSIMDDISIFRVKVTGNFNDTNDMKVTLKDLR